MTNPGKYVRQAIYDALNGVISVEVYKEDVPESEQGNHVLVRMEARSNGNVKDVFDGMISFVTEAVGVFVNTIDPDPVEDLQNEILSALKPNPSNVLDLDGDFQMVTLKPESTTNIPEDDGTKRYYRIITRWDAQVVQLTT